MTTTDQVVKVDDIFYTSWGYDQTNIDFYKVVGVSPSGQTVKIRKLLNSRVSSDGYHDQVAPGSEFAESKWCQHCRYPIRKISGAYVHERTMLVSCCDIEGRELETVAKPPEPEILTKRVRLYNGKPILTIASYAHAYPWDGAPKSQTNSYFGH